MKRSAFKNKRNHLTEEIEWSNKVRERDNYICQRCLKYGNHAHHIATRKRRPDLKYTLSNGMTLCNSCHTWVHDNPILAEELGFLNNESYEITHTLRAQS